MSGRKHRAARQTLRQMYDAVRQPVQVITYPREFVPSPDVLQERYGPTTTGEYLYPVGYTHQDGKTLIGCSYVPPRTNMHHMQALLRQQHPAFFRTTCTTG